MGVVRGGAHTRRANGSWRTLAIRSPGTRGMVRIRPQWDEPSHRDVISKTLQDPRPDQRVSQVKPQSISELGRKVGGSVEDHLRFEEQLKQQQAAAKAAILAQCDRLATACITFVAAHFDGSGDDGVTEDVKCYDSDVYAYGECEHVAHDASHLQDHFKPLDPYESQTIP